MQIFDVQIRTPVLAASYVHMDMRKRARDGRFGRCYIRVNGRYKEELKDASQT